MGVGASESGERAYFGNTGGFVGVGDSGSSRGDLHVPLDHATQMLLMKQSSFLNELPKLSAVDPNVSKAERLREWRFAVEQMIAALHSVLQDFWDWSWRVADGFISTG